MSKRFNEADGWTEGGYKYASFDKDGQLVFSRVKNGKREVSNPVDMVLGRPHYQIMKDAEKRGDLEWSTAESKVSTRGESVMSKARAQLKFLREATTTEVTSVSDLKVGDQVIFKDGTPYAGMMGQVAAMHDDSVDVMLGKALRTEIAPTDLLRNDDPAALGSKGESFRRGKKNEASNEPGYVIYYKKDTDVDGELKRKGTVVEGPFPDWDASDARSTIKDYDDESRENLTFGWGTVKNGRFQEE